MDEQERDEGFRDTHPNCVVCGLYGHMDGFCHGACGARRVVDLGDDIYAHEGACVEFVRESDRQQALLKQAYEDLDRLLLGEDAEKAAS